ncbi:unnamed protein product, partial [Porites evermanni]
WTEHDKLLLNDEKTEFLVIGPRQQLSKVKYFFDHRGKLCYNEIILPALGGRAFCYAAPNLWNNLPSEISSLDSVKF